MIYDLLDTYRQNGQGDSMVLDNYIPKEGLYFRLYNDGRDVDELLINKDTPATGEFYKWFKTVDFYSRLVDMNKPVDPKKKIHSNNMYSVFFKKYGGKYDSFISKEEELSPKFKENVIRYFDALENPKKENEKLLSAYEIPDIDVEILHRNRDYILSIADWIADRVLSYDIKSDIYIKLFFDVDVSEYRRESMRYLIPKIFNNNKHNIEADGVVYGLSNNNMGLNEKKPYLEHKTTNYKVPFRISIDNALESKNLFEWLKNQNDNGKSVLSGYIDIAAEDQFTLSKDIKDEMNSHYVHLEKGMETKIDDYDFLPGITDKIQPFRLENYLRLEEFNTEIITSRGKLETKVDEWFYNKNLVKNYYIDKVPKVKPEFTARQVDLFVISKDAMLNFFRKCDSTSLCQCIDRISLETIKELLIINTYVFIEKSNAAKAMNLRLSMLKYFKIGGKENMGDMIKPLSEILKGKVIDGQLSENQVCDDDMEFYFAAGQLTRYLISLSEAQKMNYSILDPILNAKNAEKIKMEILGLIKRYSHAIDEKSGRVNSLISMVMGYVPEVPSVVIYDAFIAGFASKNIIYYKEDVQK